MLEMYIAIFFFICVLFLSIKIRKWEKSKIEIFHTKKSSFIKFFTYFSFIIFFILLYYKIFIIKNLVSRDYFSFLYLLTLLILISYIYLSNLIITEKGIIFRGRFITWYNLYDYEVKNTKIEIIYKGFIENCLDIEINNKSEIDKVIYYLETRIK